MALGLLGCRLGTGVGGLGLVDSGGIRIPWLCRRGFGHGWIVTVVVGERRRFDDGVSLPQSSETHPYRQPGQEGDQDQSPDDSSHDGPNVRPFTCRRGRRRVALDVGIR